MFFFLLEYSTWLWSWAGTLYFQKLLEFSSGWLVVVSAIPRKGTLAGERRINSFSGGLRGTFLTSSFRRLHMINGLIHCITFEIPKACVDSLLLLLDFFVPSFTHDQWLNPLHHIWDSQSMCWQLASSSWLLRSVVYHDQWLNPLHHLELLLPLGPTPADRKNHSFLRWAPTLSIHSGREQFLDRYTREE